MRTSELIGPALDWAVAKCEGPETLYYWEAASRDVVRKAPSPSTGWSQGGPIIEREKIGTWASENPEHIGEWGARMINSYIFYGPTPLVAAMRCYVASKLGAEVEIPEGLQ